VTMLTEHEIEVRVRYRECDPMGFLHHANYFIFFEMGRTELLRAAGGNYRRMEEEGQFVVVVKTDCRYHRPARYDDVLRVRTTVTRVGPAKIEHEYHAFRGDELLAVGHSLLAIVDREGNVQRVPEWMQL
jgi:acyl-CoA thioester hydrolase